MKNPKKYLLMLFFTIALCAMQMLHVSAAPKVTWLNRYQTAYPAGRDVYYSICVVDGAKKITDLKSSDPKVLALDKLEGDSDCIWILAKGKKEGEATVSFKVGKKTYSRKITVQKFENPIESVKIGDITLPHNKWNKSKCFFKKTKLSKYDNKKIPIEIKLKNGWKMENGIIYISEKGEEYFVPVKNGKKFRYSKRNTEYMTFTVVNKKNGRTEDFWLGLF